MVCARTHACLSRPHVAMSANCRIHLQDCFQLAEWRLHFLRSMLKEIDREGCFRQPQNEFFWSFHFFQNIPEWTKTKHSVQQSLSVCLSLSLSLSFHHTFRQRKILEDCWLHWWLSCPKKRSRTRGKSPKQTRVYTSGAIILCGKA